MLHEHLRLISVFGLVDDSGLEELGQVEQDGQGEDGDDVLEDASATGLRAVHTLVVVCSWGVRVLVSVEARAREANLYNY